MSKYNEELAEQILSYIEDDTYSISEICEILNISRKTFYEWQNIKPEFRKAVKEAKECFDEKLEATARRSLMRKINNYNLIDIYKTYVPDPNDPDELILASKVVRNREYAPDIQAIKLVLARYDKKMEKQQATEKENKPLRIIVDTDESAVNVRDCMDKLWGDTTIVELGDNVDPSRIRPKKPEEPLVEQKQEEPKPEPPNSEEQKSVPPKAEEQKPEPLRVEPSKPVPPKPPV
ncbi:MAG: helix-turn-helix domain-containing protein, partial [Prevotella sp.]|nr:helix-turn-helix domain-containing protein [Prevotella sp.]